MHRLILAGLLGLCLTVVSPNVDSEDGAVTITVADSEACGVKVAVKAAPPKRNLKKRTARKPIKRGGSRVAVRKKVRQKSARKPINVGPNRQARTPKRSKRPASKRKRVAVAKKQPEKMDPVIEPESPVEPEEIKPEQKPVKTSKRRPAKRKNVEVPAVKATSKAPVIEVYFELGEAGLTTEAEEALAEQISWLNDNPSGKLVIEGHTDPVGSSKRNRKLSLERAKSVHDYLVNEASVDGDRLKVVGRGESRLRYKRKSAKNRRVVVRGR